MAVAAPSVAAAQAGEQVAQAGGNAVDVALAASLVTMVNEPGIVSLGSGGFVSVAAPDAAAAHTVDGWVDMPGRGLPDDARGRGVWEITTAYGGGVTMTIGPGSVATPGTMAAFGVAHRRWGRLPWREIWQPAISVARDGFELSIASRYYLEFVHESIFGWDPSSAAALHLGDDLVPTGHQVRLPDLADAMEVIAGEGPIAWYEGDLAVALSAAVRAGEGLLTTLDLAAYQPVVRPALTVDVGEWQVGTNPPPSVGGVTAAAMLAMLAGRPTGGWTASDTAALVEAQSLVWRYRYDRLDLATDLDAAARDLLDAVASGMLTLPGAPSTTHVSAVDDEGGACAVTVSSGYGSGLIAAGTGIWLNNCLGEPELNAGGLHALPPGRRLVSNMAPSVARRRDGAVLAIGSPGADRISTAIVQVLAGLAGGMSLADAIDHPRVHVRLGRDDPAGVGVADHEEGLDMSAVSMPRQELPARSMYFGGVTAALWEPVLGLSAAADPRRTGATVVVPSPGAARG